MDMVLMEQTQNRNYGFSSLTNGEVNEFLKVKFLVTNMLPIDEQGNRLCCAWLRSRVKFGVWRDVREQITVKAGPGCHAPGQQDRLPDALQRGIGINVR